MRGKERKEEIYHQSPIEYQGINERGRPCFSLTSAILKGFDSESLPCDAMEWKREGDRRDSALKHD